MCEENSNYISYFSFPTNEPEWVLSTAQFDAKILREIDDFLGRLVKKRIQNIFLEEAIAHFFLYILILRSIPLLVSLYRQPV